MNSLHSILLNLAVALLGCLCLTATASAEQPAALSAQFDGELLVAEDGPTFLFSGTALVNSDNMKIDLFQQTTQEHLLILVDFSAGMLTLLYPDTLNGRRYMLEEFDHHQGFARIRAALGGEQPELPAEWEETANEATQLEGVDCTYLRAENADGLSVELWTGPDNRPLRASAGQESLQINVNLHDYESIDTVDDSTFAIPEDYTITDAEEGAPAGLPQL